MATRKEAKDTGEEKVVDGGDSVAEAAAAAQGLSLSETPAEAKEGEAKDDSPASAIVSGFSITSMNMKDATTGEVMWEAPVISMDQDTEARIPSAILGCGAVSREINFRSSEEIHAFRLEQRVLFHGQCIEQWNFAFGFVIPGSTNSWQQTIEAADEMMAAEELSGNVVIETSFFDGDSFIAMNKVRIFYE
jgi:retinal rod rhodopsin-sensitive cGMP 3',5'-cyclic phosphodiesterase subunit delta